jgi:hypothetical protein
VIRTPSISRMSADGLSVVSRATSLADWHVDISEQVLSPEHGMTT